jgi:hypothetical protein
MKLRTDSNNRKKWCKLNLETRAEKMLADAANTHGLFYRHTRQAPSSHWVTPPYPTVRTRQAFFEKNFQRHYGFVFI